jgi:hypothetical protein
LHGQGVASRVDIFDFGVNFFHFFKENSELYDTSTCLVFEKQGLKSQLYAKNKEIHKKHHQNNNIKNISFIFWLF